MQISKRQDVTYPSFTDRIKIHDSLKVWLYIVGQRRASPTPKIMAILPLSVQRSNDDPNENMDAFNRQRDLGIDAVHLVGRLNRFDIGAHNYNAEDGRDD